jgi:peptide/nickel transport system substrate-binding protein
MGTYMTEYDPEKAEALLDEIGLKWDRNRQYRLLPDGRPLTINIEYVDLGSGWKERLEMKQSDWTKLGIQVLLKEVDRSLYYTKRNALEIDAGVWNNEMNEADLHYNPGRFFNAQINNNPWAQWILSNGERGERPPEEFVEFANDALRWTEQLPGTPEYDRLGDKVFTFWAEYLMSIGDLVDGPQPATFNAKLVNVPTGGPLIWPGQRFWKYYKPYQWSY